MLGDEEGVFFFVGRHPSWNDQGSLEIALVGPFLERVVLSKLIGTIPHSWCAYYFPLEPHEVQTALQGNLRMRFSLSQTSKSRVFSSTPTFKRKRASRSVVVFVCDALRQKDLGIYAKTP